MDPCTGDWGAARAEDAGRLASLSLSAQIPTRLIIEDSPRPKITLTISWNFTDWEESACTFYKNLWRWQRMLQFEVCGFKTIYASGVGAVYQRSGQFTTELDMPALSPGSHQITLPVMAIAIYDRLNYYRCVPVRSEAYQAFLYKKNQVSGTCQYMTGLPNAGFTVDKSAGNAPLPVIFTNKTTVSDPTDPDMTVLSWLWDFGDGSTDTSPTPEAHVYYLPGDYTAKLTATNSYGSTTASMIIHALAGPVSPFFSDRCTFPGEVNLGEPVVPHIMIDNQGGPGNIDLWCICQSNRLTILQNCPISGYTHSIPISIPALTPEQWLGYTPTENLTATWKFFVSPAGKPGAAFTKQFECVVYVTEPQGCLLDSDCPEGFVCVDGNCVPLSPPTQKSSNWPIFVGAAAVGVGALYLLTRGR
jgi:Cys-rich repeat protein